MTLAKTELILKFLSASFVARIEELDLQTFQCKSYDFSLALSRDKLDEALKEGPDVVVFDRAIYQSPSWDELREYLLGRRVPICLFRENPAEQPAGGDERGVYVADILPRRLSEHFYRILLDWTETVKW